MSVIFCLISAMILISHLGAHVQTFTAICRGEKYEWHCFVGGTKPPKPVNGDIWLESDEKPAVYWNCQAWETEVLGQTYHFPRKDGTRNANVWLWKGKWYERSSAKRNCKTVLWPFLKYSNQISCLSEQVVARNLTVVNE